MLTTSILGPVLTEYFAPRLLKDATLIGYGRHNALICELCGLPEETPAPLNQSNVDCSKDAGRTGQALTSREDAAAVTHR